MWSEKLEASLDEKIGAYKRELKQAALDVAPLLELHHVTWQGGMLDERHWHPEYVETFKHLLNVDMPEALRHKGDKKAAMTALTNTAYDKLERAGISGSMARGRVLAIIEGSIPRYARRMEKRLQGEEPTHDLSWMEYSVPERLLAASIQPGFGPALEDAKKLLKTGEWTLDTDGTLHLPLNAGQVEKYKGTNMLGDAITLIVRAELYARGHEEALAHTVGIDSRKSRYVADLHFEHNGFKTDEIVLDLGNGAVRAKDPVGLLESIRQSFSAPEMAAAR